MKPRNSLLIAPAAAALLTLAVPAAATLQLSANINATVFSCADQALCDTNLNLGQLQIADQIIGGVQFQGSSQNQIIGPTNSLSTSTFQLTNTLGVTVPITLAISGINYLGPVSAFSASGSGTFQSAIGSDITMTYFADPANAQGADFPTDLPGTLLGTDLKTALLATDAFAFNHTGAFVDPDTYSMSLGTSGNLTAGGVLVGRSQAIIAEQIPEPATLALLGSVLIGFGAWSRHRRPR